ncbi:hypothetical protein BGZ72_009791 [Mortierella alpina]|nr:hypothetical protein BGZ72_009791 [Mortierella alpina]
MAHQYQFNPPPPQTQQHLPLLDHQNNPTDTLRSFANAVFSYLDNYHQPKATQLLEPQKMNVLVAIMAPPEQIQATLQCSFLIFNATYVAFSVETVFNTHGACVTRSGFLTFLRSEIMSDPDEAFKDFSTSFPIPESGGSKSQEYVCIRKGEYCQGNEGHGLDPVRKRR